MSYFSKKTEASCLSEIRAASDFVRQTFQSEINLDKLNDQIESLVEQKIEDYYFQRFKDWTVADLLILSRTIKGEIEKTRPPVKVDKRSQKSKGDGIGQEIKDHA